MRTRSIGHYFCSKINMASVEIHSEFGLVILTVVTSIFMLIYKSIKVGQARKLYDVPVSILSLVISHQSNIFSL